jgi:gliding motility-associated-like protein
VNELTDCDPNSADTSRFYMPNIFSPNGDQLNDLLTLVHSPEMQIQLLEASVFDRWGNLVFFSSGNAFTWDGRFRGKDVPPGVYLYVIHVDYFQGEIKRTTLAGDVTLVR